MNHNLHGDIPKAHLELAEELLEMEADVDANPTLYGPELSAKVFVCCAHDFYAIGDDDKGSQLLEKANEVCPSYFETVIVKHIDESADYAYLVQSLTHNILELVKSITSK